MSFSVAVIGRPNVGKSTLFNRLVGKKLALVDDLAGVTRDRREGEAKLGDLEFTVIDTAGLQEGEATSLESRMRAQTEAAIAQADAIFFLIDARVGLTPADRYFAQLVRRADKPIILVANKAEGRVGEAGTYEAFGLGLGDPVAISAEHGEGLGELYDALVTALPELTAPAADAEADAAEHPVFGEEEDGSELDPTKPLRFAIVGRPNAGKSTLINRILGEERLLTGPEAGVTRDSIGIDFSWHDRAMKIFDTAGLRKRANVQDKLEKLAAADAIRAVKFADVVVVLIDATIPFERQDLSIVDLVEREGRALVIGLAKWDLVGEPAKTLHRLRDEAAHLLPQVAGSPVVPVCGLTGAGIEKLMDAIIRTHEVWNKRIATGKLNRWLAATIDRTPPPAVSGRRIKIRYMTQPKARPPTFVLFGNQLDALPTSYERYLVHGLRATFDLPGVPLRITKRQSKNPFAGKVGSGR
jgi:GTP-binding protein